LYFIWAFLLGFLSILEKVEFLDEVAALERRAIDLQQLEQIAVKLMQVEKMIEECKGKLSDAEKAIAEFRLKSVLEKRFSDIAGLPYMDKSTELEEKAKTFKASLTDYLQKGLNSTAKS